MIGSDILCSAYNSVGFSDSSENSVSYSSQIIEANLAIQMLSSLNCYLFSLGETTGEKQMPKNVNNHFQNYTSRSSLVTASVE